MDNTRSISGAKARTSDVGSAAADQIEHKQCSERLSAQCHQLKSNDGAKAGNAQPGQVSKSEGAPNSNPKTGSQSLAKESDDYKTLHAMVEGRANELSHELNKVGAIRDNEQIVQKLAEMSPPAIRDLRETHNLSALTHQLKEKLNPCQFERAMAYLEISDPSSSGAHMVRALLLQRQSQSSFKTDLELDVAGLLGTKIESQIQKTSQAYSKLFGSTLDQAVRQERFSPEDQGLVDITIKGKDKRHDEDVLALAVAALQSSNSPLFEHAITIVNPRARQMFMQGGDDRILKAFGSDSQHPNNKTIRALEYEHFGHLGLESQIRANTGFLKDNDDAIEQAIKTVSAEERGLFQLGWNISHNPKVKQIARSSDQEQALDYYNRVHSALVQAAGKPLSAVAYNKQMSRWEDLLLVPGGGLVAKIADGIGVHWFNADRNEVVSTVEGIDRPTWQYFKENPQQRLRVGEVLESFGADTRLEARELFERKMQANNFEQADGCKRTILQLLQSKPTDPDKLFSAIAAMSAPELEKFRTNSEYRSAMEHNLSNVPIHEQYRQAALGFIVRLAEKKQPAWGLMETAHYLAATQWSDKDGNTRPPSVVFRTVQEAIKKDPETFKQIQSDGGRSTEFIQVLSEAMPWPDLDRQEATEMLKTLVKSGDGRLPLSTQLKFDLSYVDKRGVLYDLINAKPEDLAKLSSDEKAKHNVFQPLTAQERTLAETVLAQRKMEPEDFLRMYVLFHDFPAKAMQNPDRLTPQVLEILEKATQTESGKQDLQTRYFKKYGSHVSSDLKQVMPSSEFKQAKIALDRIPKNADEAFTKALDKYSSARQKSGAWFVDHYIDGTGFQCDGAFNKLLNMFAACDQQRWDKLSDAEKNAYFDQLYTSLNQLATTEAMVSDAAVNVVETAAAVGGAAVSGGASLSLLVRVAVFSAVINRIARQTMVNDGSNSAFSNQLKQVLSGAINGGLYVIGPNELAELLRFGEHSGRIAAALATRQLAEKSTQLLSSQGVSFLAENGGRDFAEKLAAAVRSSMVKGEANVDKGSIAKVAQQLAKGTEQAKEVEAVINDSLATAMKDQTNLILKRAATAYTLTASNNGVVGAVSTFSGETIAGTPPRQAIQDASIQGLAGAATAGTLHGLLHIGTKGGVAALPAQHRPFMVKGGVLSAGDLAGATSSVTIAPMQISSFPSLNGDLNRDWGLQIITVK